MKNFKLTLKRPDSSDEFLELSNKVMSCLRKDFELEDEPEFANMTLADLLGDDLKDLALLVNGNDFTSTVNRLGALKLVGDQYGISDEACPECGHPEYYYTGCLMVCVQCEHSEEAPEDYLNGDIGDMSGYVAFDKNQIR